MGKFVEVADVLGFDPQRLWYYIEGFNGYEISNDGYVRSMKHYKSYPTGMLIRPKTKDGQTFELSDDYNRRVKITRSELWDIAMHNKYIHAGYPRKTHLTDASSRNIKAFIPPSPKPVEKTGIIPKFTIIKEKTDPISPVYDLLGRGIYYGRQ